jgi:hypothetical protein
MPSKQEPVQNALALVRGKAVNQSEQLLVQPVRIQLDGMKRVVDPFPPRRTLA